jgi:putative membrane protein
MNSAAQGNRAEIVLSQLATRRGYSNSVRQYGQHMINDHTKAGRQLNQLADRLDVTLLNGIDADHQEARARLGQMRGRRFDRAFIQQMISDHVDTIALFQKEIRQGADPDVKNFARQTLPTLREHLRMARQLRSNR